MATSKDGTFIDVGEFPVSIGAYTTLPKTSSGQPINSTTAKFLDVVHLDIAASTVMDIPLDPTISPHYIIKIDDGTTKSVPVSKMSSLILKPSTDPSDSSHLLPPFLHLNFKITYEHHRQYQRATS